ncbi:response regulator [Pseudomonas fluorescens]|uniref:response regulator n=1 Tax=Pseudomonas TaxID=286 RepID=UPI003D02D167
MPNRYLRIFVADDQRFQRLSIEKMLNQLGYRRIAPVESLGDVVILMGNAFEPFDLLIISSALAIAVDVDIDGFCRSNPQIRHALIYDGQGAQFLPISLPLAVVVQASLLRMTDSESIRPFMEVTDLQSDGLHLYIVETR